MIATVEAAEFGGSRNIASANTQVSSLIAQANALLTQAKALAFNEIKQRKQPDLNKQIGSPALIVDLLKEDIHKGYPPSRLWF